MSAILPFIHIDSSSLLTRYFTPYQICWITAEDPFHEAKKQVFALGEKSVRIGWTFCDGFKNVRKRLRFHNRDYLFVTKDWPSALEYMNHVYDFADLCGYTRAVLSHGEDLVKVKSLDPEGNPTSITEEVKIGYIKFQNGSRIIAFSSNPYAMAVYGGDVGLDEFAKHPNAKLLWQTAQSRVTWNFDMAVWSSHDGEDTLFNQFAIQARAAYCSLSASGGRSDARPTFGSDGEGQPALRSASDERGSEGERPCSHSFDASIEIQKSKIENGNTTSSPWNLYFKVTMPDAVELGLLDVINRTQDTNLTPDQFLADCQTRSGSDEIYQQSYMCNPLGSAANHIIEWSAIERCREDYHIERVHLEADDILRRFGEFSSYNQQRRESQIETFLKENFPALLSGGSPSPGGEGRGEGGRYYSGSKLSTKNPQLRLGFDVAASGQGDLAAIYIDQVKGESLWLAALFTCRTEDWNFLKTVLFFFLHNLKNVQAAGDESGLGRQICWEAAAQFSSRFIKVNFAAKKSDLGIALMNQLSNSEKHFPKNHPDIAADFFALRKSHTGTRWIFTEGRNHLNANSHCDIAWAAALASHAHTERKSSFGCAVLLDNGMIMHSDGRLVPCPPPPEFPTDPAKAVPATLPTDHLLWSDDPRIWTRRHLW